MARGLMSYSEACGILVPQRGFEPVSPAVQRQVLNHWTTREVPAEELLFILVVELDNTKLKIRYYESIRHLE